MSLIRSPNVPSRINKTRRHVTHGFRLHCLGTPALLTADGEQVPFRTRKHLALLVRLALEPGKQFTRDYLADLLWPDAPPRHANHSLAQGLSVIKAKIAREAVVIRRATVGLAAGWIDADVLHLSETDVAINGPFLEGFEIAEARPFEDWKDEYRARLIPQVRDCLVRQMDAARRIGDFVMVEKHATRLQDLDPLSEEGIRGVMEARAWASDRSGALKAFARYEARLADELNAKPSPELVRMADLLRDGRRPAGRPVAPGYSPARADRRFEPETLIGREREFGVLYDAWLDARRRSPRIVVVTSDPGVGKTTLVNAFAASCQMEGAVVARAQAYDAERELPFAVLGELVKQLAAQKAIGSADPEALSELTRITSEILKAFPGVPKPVEWSPELTPLRIADAVLKTVTAAAAESPVVLVIDDVHAADNASTAILHSVARKLSDTRVLVIVTGRTSELRRSGAPWAFVSDETIASLTPLDLEVLSRDATEQLIHRLVPTGNVEPPMDRVLKASGGNPLAIALLTREWMEHGPDSLLHNLETLNTVPVPSLGIPRAIAAVFHRQFSRLDSTSRATLGLAAILGRRLMDLALYDALDIPPANAVESLSRLKDEGFLREVRGDLEFRNELIRGQAYYAVPGPARLQLHRQIAELMAERPNKTDAGVALEIAWHFLRGDSGSRAISFAHRGAQAFLAIGAPHEAEEVLSALMDVSQPHDVLRRTQLLLAKALLDQSKADEALPLVNSLEGEQPGSFVEQAEIAMLRASAEFLLNTEPGEKYCEVARTALQRANKTGDPDLIARALFECARAGNEQGVPGLVQIAEEGIRRLGDNADVSTIPIVFVTHALCRMFRMNSLEFLKDVGNVIQRRQFTANAAQLSFIYSAKALASLNLCRLDDALDAYLTAFELAKRVGDDARMSVLASNICVVRTASGHYDDAIRWGELSVNLGESSKSSALQMTYTNLVDALVLTGQEVRAVTLMDQARDWLVPKRRWKFHCGFLVVNAAFELTRGNVPLALDIIREVETVAKGREESNPIPGPYWKLRIFRSEHLGNRSEAWRQLNASSAMFREQTPLHYLDILAAKAWLELRTYGRNSEETTAELKMFDEFRAVGRRALLTAQGFLRPWPSLESRAASESTAPLATNSHVWSYRRSDGSHVNG